jgi:hypothetical protein
LTPCFEIDDSDIEASAIDVVARVASTIAAIEFFILFALLIRLVVPRTNMEFML